MKLRIYYTHPRTAALVVNPTKVRKNAKNLFLQTLMQTTRTNGKEVKFRFLLSKSGGCGFTRSFICH